jgi:cytidylate kinase
VIAIDGTAGSGKTTLARRLTAHFGLPFLDTGLLYRVVARRVFDAGGDPEDPVAAQRAAESVRLADLDRADLRDEAVGQAASQVAALPGVRAALLAIQRRFAAQAPGAVLAGRDIGTVVCPDATHKIFVTASAEVRAGRRLAELRGRGMAATYDVVLQDLRRRDARDQSRAFAPLSPAPDALVLDTTGLDAEAAFVRARDYVGGDGGAR